MESNGKYAVSCGIRYYISAIIAFFVYLSLVVVMTGAFTKVVGYTAYSADNNEVLYHYYYEDGEDTQKDEYAKQGIEVSTVALRSTLSGKPKFFAVAIAQCVAAAITLAFIHNSMWKLGNTDANLVNFSHISEDRLRGVKIGAMASLPGVIAYLLAVLAKFKVIPYSFIAVYRFLNYQFFALGNVFFGSSLTDYSNIGWGKLAGSACMLLILPLCAGIFYILGYKNISISENLIYKKDLKK